MSPVDTDQGLSDQQTYLIIPQGDSAAGLWLDGFIDPQATTTDTEVMEQGTPQMTDMSSIPMLAGEWRLRLSELCRDCALADSGEQADMLRLARSLLRKTINMGRPRVRGGNHDLTSYGATFDDEYLDGCWSIDATILRWWRIVIRVSEVPFVDKQSEALDAINAECAVDGVDDNVDSFKKKIISCLFQNLSRP